MSCYRGISCLREGVQVHPLQARARGKVPCQKGDATGDSGKRLLTVGYDRRNSFRIMNTRSGRPVAGRTLFNEPMRVETVRSTGAESWAVVLSALRSERFRSVNLSTVDLGQLTILDSTCTYDGDGGLLRLACRRMRSDIAYEF
jgi:hypothetical protein